MISQELYLLAEKVGKALAKKSLSLVTAESCTGGAVAQMITAVPNASQWFERGFVVYSNKAKQEMLGVPAEIIQKYGAVSSETAHAMAAGAIKHSYGQAGVAITGIAGPTGGSVEKPVGLVWFGFATQGQLVQTLSQQFKGSREEVNYQAVKFALEQLLQLLY